MTRVLIDMPNDMLKNVDDVAAKQNISRAALVRLAVSSFLKNSKKSTQEKAFGILQGSPIDGLVFQRKSREQW